MCASACVSVYAVCVCSSAMRTASGTRHTFRINRGVTIAQGELVQLLLSRRVADKRHTIAAAWTTSARASAKLQNYNTNSANCSKD